MYKHHSLISLRSISLKRKCAQSLLLGKFYEKSLLINVYEHFCNCQKAICIKLGKVKNMSIRESCDQMQYLKSSYIRKTIVKCCTNFNFSCYCKCILKRKVCANIGYYVFLKNNLIIIFQNFLSLIFCLIQRKETHHNQ